MTPVKTTPWGKHDQIRGQFHPLADHCLDVATTWRLLADRPNLARGIAGLTKEQKDRLAVVAFLHDLGKCNRGFQAKADPNAQQTAGHVMEALWWLFDPKLQPEWPPGWCALLGEMANWFANEEQAAQMLIASISHHGRPISFDNDIQQCIARTTAKYRKALWTAADDYDPKAALDDLASAARKVFPGAFANSTPAIDATPELQHRFAGLVMLADWIGSDTQFFPYRQSAAEDRLAFAKEAAERALRAIGLIPPEPRQPKSFAETFRFEPTALQSALAMELTPDDENRLLLVESDTGSGKTEAALAWFFRLYADGKVDGLYFALPTRVAARELYERVLKAVERAFDSDQRPGPVLLAAPGYVKVDGQPVLPDPNGALWDDNAQDAKRERLWSAERPKRFLAAPVAVGTIDQALLSALQAKHSLMRSVCLDRHLLVVDEVHASDPYMREVLKRLLQGHLGRGGWALLLSATLGETAAAEFFERGQLSLAEASARPYPVISCRNKAWPMPASRLRRIRIELSPTLEDDDALVPMLLEALEKGARVLVVCNTVRRANALFRRAEAALTATHPHLLPALFGLNGMRCPHHGRFAREDRELLDAAVTAQLGKGSPSGARLLIGTQTLEQSLDIDADWLVTDLAPMDVLIQRFGRLHRHERPARPAGFATPRVLVRAPSKALSAYLNEEGELRAPAGLGRVYADGRVLAATWQLLAARQEIALPGEARELIERSTHPEALDALPDAVWRKHRQLLEGQIRAEIIQAMRSLLEEKPFGELHYPDKGEVVLTRLGDPTFEVPLTEPMPSPFGAMISRVAIPARWLEGIELPDTVAAEKTPDGFCVAVADKKFRYTRFGLEKDDA